MQENEGGDFGLRQNLELGKLRSSGLFNHAFYSTLPIYLVCIFFSIFVTSSSKYQT